MFRLQERENHAHRDQRVRAGKRKAEPKIGYNRFGPPAVQRASPQQRNVPQSSGAGGGFVPSTHCVERARPRQLGPFHGGYAHSETANHCEIVASFQPRRKLQGR